MKRVDVRRPWVPGPGGYVIAYVISCAFFSLGLVVYLANREWSGVQLGVYWPAVAVVCVVAGAPVGAAWAAVLHLTSRRLRSPALRLLVAGLVAAVLVPPWLNLVFFRDDWGLRDYAVVAAGAGACGALARRLARRWIRP